MPCEVVDQSAIMGPNFHPFVASAGSDYVAIRRIRDGCHPVRVSNDIEGRAFVWRVIDLHPPVRTTHGNLIVGLRDGGQKRVGYPRIDNSEQFRRIAGIIKDNDIAKLFGRGNEIVVTTEHHTHDAQILTSQV